MSKKFDHKSTLATLLAQENIDQASWARIFTLSALLTENELKTFHESVTEKIKEASEAQASIILVEMAKHGILKTIEVFKADFSPANAKEFCMIFLRSHYPNHPVVLNIIDSLAPWIDLNSRDNDEFTFVEEVAARGEETVMKHLLENDSAYIDMESRDKDGMTLLTRLASLIHSTTDEVLKEKRERIFVMFLKKKNPQITEKEIEEQKKLSLAKEILNLTYSTQDAPSGINLAAVCLEVLPHLDLTEDKKELWGEILGKIARREEFTTADGTFLGVRESKLKRHRSYFVMERNANGNVLSLRYGDGNDISMAEKQRLEDEIKRLSKKDKSLPLHKQELLIDKKKASESQITAQITDLRMDDKYQYHVMKFAVKDGVTTEQLSDILTTLFEGTAISDLDSRLSAIVRDYAKLDATGRPVVEMLVPTKEQSRGNCVWKAFAILIRSILQEVYGKEIELVDGKPCGEGYDLYKEFKSALIDFFAHQIVELSNSSNAGQFFYEEALQFSEDVLMENLFRKNGLADSTGKDAPDATVPNIKMESLDPKLLDTWWRDEIRSLDGDKECADLIEYLKHGLIHLLEHKEIFLAPEIDRTLPRMKTSNKGVLIEGDFAFLRSKDEKVKEFLVDKEFAARSALVKDPSNLTHIANLMLCLLSTATTSQEVQEFKELKMRFLKQVKEPKQASSAVGIALATHGNQIIPPQ
jgi:hypothetical protein